MGPLSRTSINVQPRGSLRSPNTLTDDWTHGDQRRPRQMTPTVAYQHQRSFITYSSWTSILPPYRSYGEKIEFFLKNYQYGFRKQKGTRETVFGLRVLIGKQIEKNKVTYMAFLDLEKAFDNVN